MSTLLKFRAADNSALEVYTEVVDGILVVSVLRHDSGTPIPRPIACAEVTARTPEPFDMSNVLDGEELEAWRREQAEQDGQRRCKQCGECSGTAIATGVCFECSTSPVVA